MAPRKNGPRAGPTHGTDWQALPIGEPKLYRGSATGCKSNTCRANKRYQEMRFRSFKLKNKVYIERLK